MPTEGGVNGSIGGGGCVNGSIGGGGVNETEKGEGVVYRLQKKIKIKNKIKIRQLCARGETDVTGPTVV
jgi:hypothetical protein